MIKVDLSGAEKFFAEGGPDYAAAAKAHETLVGRTGAGADFTGWLELPRRIRDGELPAILDAARLIRSRSKVLVVIGIGGGIEAGFLKNDEAMWGSYRWNASDLKPCNGSLSYNDLR